jgi:hypothetical protein
MADTPDPLLAFLQGNRAIVEIIRRFAEEIVALRKRVDELERK